MLLLGNADIQKLVTAKECVSWLEEEYRELSDNRAGTVPGMDLVIAKEGAGAIPHQVFRRMIGTSSKQGIMALRLNSDVVSWTMSNGPVRRIKIAAASDPFAGLVMLFSRATGEPLAVFPDAAIQRLRVGATNALAAQYLAKPSACTVGLLGSGWQAGSNLLALCSTFPVNCVKVYSPNEDHRRRFAAEMMHALECEIVCAGSAKEATEDVDIVVCATNARRPVMRADWLKPGVHLTCGHRAEVEAEAYRRSDILVQHYSASGDRHLLEEKSAGYPASVPKENVNGTAVDWANVPELRDLVIGHAARRKNDQEITCFCNNVGTGLQFAALGARVYNRARERGVGTELPTEWFTQDVRP